MFLLKKLLVLIIILFINFISLRIALILATKTNQEPDKNEEIINLPEVQHYYDYI